MLCPGAITSPLSVLVKASSFKALPFSLVALVGALVPGALTFLEYAPGLPCRSLIVEASDLESSNCVVVLILVGGMSTSGVGGHLFGGVFAANAFISALQSTLCAHEYETITKIRREEESQARIGV